MGEEIPRWAKERAVALTANEGGPLYDIHDPRLFSQYPEGGYRNQCVVAFARYIAEHEEPPVDPLLIEARELAAADILIDARVNGIYSDEGNPFWGEEAVPVLLSGNADQSITVQSRLRALRRGMELAREQSK